MFYKVETTRRWFKPQVLYDQVDWTRLDTIVDAFSDRVTEWYIGPAESLRASGHYAFGAMALNCLLIDALSQFNAGVISSSRTIFIAFVRQWFPEFAVNFPTPIMHCDGSRPPTQMTDFADALYHAFRCGILHEAHVAPYGMVRSGAPGDPAVEFQAAGYTKYAASGVDCPTVMIDPWKLLDQVTTVLAGYVANLKNPDSQHDELRERFKIKFTESFGVDIRGAS